MARRRGGGLKITSLLAMNCHLGLTLSQLFALPEKPREPAKRYDFPKAGGPREMIRHLKSPQGAKSNSKRLC